MVTRVIDECKPYETPGHFAMTAMRVHGNEESESQKFFMGLPHFLPSGGVWNDESPTEKMYFVLEGEIVVADKNGNKIRVGKNESIHIGAKERRSILNESDMPASMLVIINYLD